MKIKMSNIIFENSFYQLTSLLITLGDCPSKNLLCSLKSNNTIFNYNKRPGLIKVQPTKELWWLEKHPKKPWLIKGLI